MALLNLIPATSGKVFIDNQDISNFKNLNKNEKLKLRKKAQIIFQDPYSSLNPRLTLNKTLEIPMLVHGLGNAAERKDRVAYLLEKVGFSPEQGNRLPHQFSGGQRQRIGIARALSVNPQIIIGDEPVSALDVSIQAQIINLLVELQKEFNLSYIIIAHDLAVVEYISDRIAVMYLGKIIETAPRNEFYSNPMHPYTQALLSAVPVADPTRISNRIILKGDVPSPRNLPKGCAFHQRCPVKMKQCEIETPELKELPNGHLVSCWRT